MSATASGSKAAPNSDAKSRDHNQGNQERKYTIEQKTAVLRVRKCSATAFYEILSLEKGAGEADVKKAYRKLSLLTHPDKNGYDGADEAFKMVSRAFQILSDPDKKSRFDQFGGDPDNRFSSSGAGASGASTPFAGFARSQGGRHPIFDPELSPEDLFNQFFGGGGGGAGGPFSPFGGGMGGSSFVFNMGGGPGLRVHQFGGAGPRRRPRNAAEQEAPPSGVNAFSQLLPILLLFILPLLTSLFSGSTSSSGPEVLFQSSPPNTLQRTTPRFHVEYYVDPNVVDGYSDRKLRQLDQTAEVKYINTLKYECHVEFSDRSRMLEEAQGWFSVDQRKVRQARAMPMRSCNQLNDMGIPRQY